MGWRKLSDADGYPQLPAESRAKIWVTDLRAAGITHLLPLKLGWFASGNGFRALLDDKEFTWKPRSFRLNRPGFDRIPFEEIGLYLDAPFRTR